MIDETTSPSILLVEESPVVADASSLMLHDIGLRAVRPAANLASALQLAREAEFEIALVDLNIRGEKSFSVLRVLANRNIPFALTSGYADWTLPDVWKDRPRFPQPYTELRLREVVEKLCHSLAIGWP